MKNRNIIYDKLQPLFERFVFIESVSWEQYTPYDLESNFYLNKESIKINNNNITPLFNLALRKMIESTFDKNTEFKSKKVFGDHVSVIIKRDKSITVKDLHHV